MNNKKVASLVCFQKLCILCDAAPDGKLKIHFTATVTEPNLVIVMGCSVLYSIFLSAPRLVRCTCTANSDANRINT